MPLENPSKRTERLFFILISMIYVFLAFRAFPPLEAVERAVYSMEMRLDVPKHTGINKIAIVDIDEKSLQRLGPWPWPRNVIADMINILHTNGATLIGLDFIFNQKEQNQGLLEVAALYEDIAEQHILNHDEGVYDWILERLTAVEKKLDTDRKLLGTVERAGNVVFPVLGEFGQYSTDLVLPLGSFLEGSALQYTNITQNIQKHASVNQLITPFPELAAASRGLGHINLSSKQGAMGYAHLPYIDYRGHIIPSMPLRLASDYLNKFPEQIVILDEGVQLGRMLIPTTKGQIFFKFKGGRGSFPHYSFVDILEVKRVPNVFEGRIVLVGMTAEHLGTFVQTPTDPRMPRVELNANIIDGFIHARYTWRPEIMTYVEALLILLFGLVSTYGLNRRNMSSRTAILVMLLFVLFLMGLTVFMTLDIRFKITYIVLNLLTLHMISTVKYLMVRKRPSLRSSRQRNAINRMLGLSFQSQGMLDLAFENFKKCPLDDAMKDVVYNLGLDFERQKLFRKAISAYDYIRRQDAGFRDLNTRMIRLKKMVEEMPLASDRSTGEEKKTASEGLKMPSAIGRYAILGEMGRGAMGIVYRARDPQTSQLVAIKAIDFSKIFARDQILEAKALFFKEAQLAKKLTHPSIVSIYDVGEEDGLIYLTMEIVEGNSLQGFCEKEALLPLGRLSHIMAETADALEYAHNRGVIHRDIKPTNILLLKNWHVKVTDFGIAAAFASDRMKSGVVLTPPDYLSPEQVNGEPIDGRSDIFSIGVLYFQLLTGQLPFQSKTLSHLFYQISQAPPPSPREINPKIVRPCEQIIDKALQKDPEMRFQRAAHLARYLRILGEKLNGLHKKK